LHTYRRIFVPQIAAPFFSQLNDLWPFFSKIPPNKPCVAGCRSGDEDFKEAVDLYTSGRLEESLHLARESLRRSTEDLLQGEEPDDGEPNNGDAEGYTRLEDDGDNTEVEGTLERISIGENIGLSTSWEDERENKYDRTQSCLK